MSLSLLKLDGTCSITSLDLWCDWQRVVLKWVRPFLPLIIDWCLSKDLSASLWLTASENDRFSWNLLPATIHAWIHAWGIRLKVVNHSLTSHEVYLLFAWRGKHSLWLLCSPRACVVCGVVCGVVCRGSRSIPAHALLSHATNLYAHPLGGGSQNHPWRIRHGRAIYWWRRHPHHQKSNRHWDFTLLEFKCPAWETTLVCDRFIAPPRDHRTVPTSLCCFQQITRKVIRRIGPQERKQDEVVM